MAIQSRAIWLRWPCVPRYQYVSVSKGMSWSFWSMMHGSSAFYVWCREMVMSEPRLTEMSDAEFEALIDGHIERTAAGANEVPADIFVDLLLERFDVQADAPITL